MNQRPPASPPLPLPAQLGPYPVEGRIGQGAMGAVYLARDPRTERPLAVKTLRLQQGFHAGAFDEARQRFAREAQAAARLVHPGIVAVVGSGEDRGLAWIAMEVQPGGDLAACTAPGGLLPVPMVLRLAAQVAEALAYAHRQGVVHRDIKPANILFDREADSVKVTDFGIAFMADAHRTRTGVLLGTPAYMSPEQIAGQQLDGRSDLYSLGVMLFQLLCGQLPHPAESMAAQMRQIATQPAPDIRSLRPQVSAEVAEVLAQALQKRRESRPADGDRMAAALRLAIEGQIGGAEPA